ncbi:MAG TPA: vitamin K epoxide reductase family protein, partial [bacterium]
MSKKSKRAKSEASKSSESSKASEPREPKAHARAASREDRLKLPNWPLLVLALAGAAVAGYLTYTSWAGNKLAFCEAGGGCDIVQSSRWATFLGAPTAFWGLLTYLALAYIAVRMRKASLHWQLAWLITLVGWGISIYLTAISVFVLQATCPYCLTSLGILTAILVLLALRKPDGIERFQWRGWLLQTGSVALIAVAGMHFMQSGLLDRSAGPEDPYLRGLAIQLTERGAKFYGAYWCPHCQEQKRLFGASAQRLPYVECSPGGPQGPSAPECVAQGIRSFPTWIFPDGDRISAVQPPEDLAKHVGYGGPAPAS